MDVYYLEWDTSDPEAFPKRLSDLGFNPVRVSPIDPDSYRIDVEVGRNADSEVRNCASKLASHLKAIQLFLETNEPLGFITDNDVDYPDDFLDKLQDILKHVPPKFSLISIAWNGGIAEPFISDTEQVKTLVPLQPGVFGASGYLITPSWGVEAVRRFRKTWDLLSDDDTTVHSIIWHSGGYQTVPSLGYPPGDDSTTESDDESSEFSNLSDGVLVAPTLEDVKIEETKLRPGSELLPGLSDDFF